MLKSGLSRRFNRTERSRCSRRSCPSCSCSAPTAPAVGAPAEAQRVAAPPSLQLLRCSKSHVTAAGGAPALAVGLKLLGERPVALGRGGKRSQRRRRARGPGDEAAAAVSAGSWTSSEDVMYIASTTSKFAVFASFALLPAGPASVGGNVVKLLSMDRTACWRASSEISRGDVPSPCHIVPASIGFVNWLPRRHLCPFLDTALIGAADDATGYVFASRPAAFASARSSDGGRVAVRKTTGTASEARPSAGDSLRPVRATHVPVAAPRRGVCCHPPGPALFRALRTADQRPGWPAPRPRGGSPLPGPKTMRRTTSREVPLLPLSAQPACMLPCPYCTSMRRLLLCALNVYWVAICAGQDRRAGCVPWACRVLRACSARYAMRYARLGMRTYRSASITHPPSPRVPARSRSAALRRTPPRSCPSHRVNSAAPDPRPSPQPARPPCVQVRLSAAPLSFLCRFSPSFHPTY